MADVFECLLLQGLGAGLMEVAVKFVTSQSTEFDDLVAESMVAQKALSGPDILDNCSLTMG
jgi:hypothetical protein